MEILLNRWRGTGRIIGFLTGNIIYALYISLLVGFMSTWYYGIIGALLYILGESMGWGKWVGYLTSDTSKPNYDELEGYNFPYIHKTASLVVNEREDYKSYCEVALAIRGFYWWTPLLIFLGFIDLLSWYQVTLNSIILAVGFPIACYIGKEWNFEYKSKYLNMSKGWENQEVVYGFFQFMCLTLSIVWFS